jgi:hypothetical protein
VETYFLAAFHVCNVKIWDKKLENRMRWEQATKVFLMKKERVGGEREREEERERDRAVLSWQQQRIPSLPGSGGEFHLFLTAAKGSDISWPLPVILFLFLTEAGNFASPW